MDPNAFTTMGNISGDTCWPTMFGSHELYPKHLPITELDWTGAAVIGLIFQHVPQQIGGVNARHKGIQSLLLRLAIKPVNCNDMRLKRSGY